MASVFARIHAVIPSLDSLCPVLTPSLRRAFQLVGMRSGENALFSFSPAVAQHLTIPLRSKAPLVPKSNRSRSEEQPHEENSLDEILQLRGQRSSFSLDIVLQKP